MLEIRGLRSGYPGGPDVLTDIDVTVETGEVVALVGLNGAGKSTLVKSACGLIPARGGTVSFDGRDVTALSTDERVRLGLMLVPEGRELFPTMSVADTLTLGTYPIPRASRAATAATQRDLVFELFPVLADRLKQSAGTLSGGEQQMLAISRSLMSAPRMLVLDEPSLGLAPRLIETIFAALKRLNAEGLTVLLVEQNATVAIDASSRAYLMELGRILGTATSEELRGSATLGALITGSGGESSADVAARPPARIPRYSPNAAAKGAALELEGGE